ncbi:MAG: AMP-binding protein [Pseudomonadales bacterium]
MTLHFASIWEAVADYAPDRPAVICDDVKLSWQQYEQRAARIAAALQEAGLGAGSKVGLYLHNSSQYLESQFAVFKIDGCPINVNYRYKADELVYLLENSDAEALVFQSSYAMRIWEIKDRLPNIKLFLQVDDGSAEVLLDFATAYESVQRDFEPLPPIEHDPEGVYMLYTGGTTGMPKGVMYNVVDFSTALTGLGAASQEMTPPTTLAEYREYLRATDAAPVSLPACPMMHGTGMWLGCMVPHAQGGTVVATSKLGLDPDHLWELVQEHRVNDLVIVGDAFAKPLLASLQDAATRNRPYRPDSLKQIISSGVMWSAEVKQALLEHIDCALVDVMGSSEGGMGSSVTSRDMTAPTAKFALNEGVKVFTDDGREVEPGSKEIGKLATSGSVPLGYYKDEAKSAATFREINGVRYSFPGDYASVAADGSITLLGRGSACINTAGEKVFPEEVEEALKRHPQLYDVLVVGLPDDRFGERVVAVASAQDGATLDPQGVIDFAREQLAGYKVPKQVLVVDQVQRAPNGKADYKWARKTAEQVG